MAKKELIVVAGPNGAGKSTFVNSFLTERQWPYLCADVIAKEFAQLDPMSQQIVAGREFLRRLEDQLAKDEDFIVETTLSGRTFQNYVHRARTTGFSITIVFIYLDSSETSLARVRARVLGGGHNVPDADVRRRFKRSCANFWHRYRQIADQWVAVYNAGNGFIEVAFGIEGDEFLVSDEVLFGRLLELAKENGNG